MMNDLVGYVRHELFPKWKFFMNRKQLEFSNQPDTVCYQICKGMHVFDTYAVKWWEECHDKILDTLNSKRADVTAAIKKGYFRKWAANCFCFQLDAISLLLYCSNTSSTEEMTSMKKRNTIMPSLDDLLKLSKNCDTYQWLCSRLMKCVVGYMVWSRSYYKRPLAEIATCSDESFLLLTIENNYERWQDEWTWKEVNKDKEDHEKTAKSFALARYTNSGKSTKNGRSKRFSGWSRDGYLRFNAIYGQVADDRKYRANFETTLQESFAQEQATAGFSSDKEDEDDDEIYPANDMEVIGRAKKATLVTPGKPNEETEPPASDDESSSSNSNSSRDDSDDGL